MVSGVCIQIVTGEIPQFMYRSERKGNFFILMNEILKDITPTHEHFVGIR